MQSANLQNRKRRKNVNNMVRSFLAISFALTLACASSTKEDWFKDCLDKGFDPKQLACSTCDLLPREHQENCQKCCQTFRDLVKATKPYHSAILVIRTKSEEIDNLLKDDMEDLVRSKGPDKLKVNQDEAESSSMYYYNPSYVYFFEKASDNLDDAKEKIALNTWSRDEIKEMLSMLL